MKVLVGRINEGKAQELLDLTDWTQLPDVTQAIKDKYKDYRQSLRDITKTYKNLNEVIWPKLP